MAARLKRHHRPSMAGEPLSPGSPLHKKRDDGSVASAAKKKDDNADLVVRDEYVRIRVHHHIVRHPEEYMMHWTAIMEQSMLSHTRPLRERLLNSFDIELRSDLPRNPIRALMSEPLFGQKVTFEVAYAAHRRFFGMPRAADGSPITSGGIVLQWICSDLAFLFSDIFAPDLLVWLFGGFPAPTEGHLAGFDLIAPNDVSSPMLNQARRRGLGLFISCLCDIAERLETLDKELADSLPSDLVEQLHDPQVPLWRSLLHYTDRLTSQEAANGSTIGTDLAANIGQSQSTKNLTKVLIDSATSYLSAPAPSTPLSPSDLAELDSLEREFFQLDTEIAELDSALVARNLEAEQLSEVLREVEDAVPAFSPSSASSPVQVSTDALDAEKLSSTVQSFNCLIQSYATDRIPAIRRGVQHFSSMASQCEQFAHARIPKDIFALGNDLIAKHLVWIQAKKDVKALVTDLKMWGSRLGDPRLNFPFLEEKYDKLIELWREFYHGCAATKNFEIVIAGRIRGSTGPDIKDYLRNNIVNALNDTKNTCFPRMAYYPPQWVEKAEDLFSKAEDPYRSYVDCL